MKRISVITGFVLSIIVMILSFSLTIYHFISFNEVDVKLLGLSAVTLILALINTLNYFKYKREQKENSQ